MKKIRVYNYSNKEFSKRLQYIQTSDAFNFFRQMLLAFSNSFPTLGFIIFWLIYRHTQDWQQASIGFLSSSILALLNLIYI